MSGPERKIPQFAPELEENIDFYASFLAEQGEEAIDDLRKERDGIVRLRLIYLKVSSNEIVFQGAQALGQSIEVVNEIINRASKIMRDAGTDRVSEMRKLVVGERLGYLNDQAPEEEGE
ncbi:hypothetical protein KKH23_02780 [Patescibacteria group bacterium]|nr:hypothetical protein [Patescibacteria group bacterium]MBU0777329.1 hypothetical protein [Patescibacteria group bacterium]MBU0846091.1 hypothetical protein [Patescibacteria group bacterium]MBU0923144.1 hypothetical protein [Patescibacteria group bacterium]MBU1066859.1 hypothetical protein [Patescibacteria group bacterium]